MSNLRSIKVTYSDGQIIHTNMAAGLTDKEMIDYFKIGSFFNLGDGRGGDNMQKIINTEITK